MNTQLQTTLKANSEIAAQATREPMVASENIIAEQAEAEEKTYDHTATYSAEDDKIRIYFSYFLDAEEYKRVTDLGFRNAPKQGCHFAVWSPNREDFALEMAGEITAEGTTLAERAEAKAERLDTYATNSAAKANSFYRAANSISERFAYGQPILVGHHSERKARRDKARMESAMSQANIAGEKVNYWNYKLRGVLHHANYKNRDDVRERRIKTLLAELRSYQRVINTSYLAIKFWEKLESNANSENFFENVKTLCGYPDMSPYLKDSKSCWGEMDTGNLTADQVLEISLDFHYRVVEGRNRYRCISHTLNRLAYERSELGDVEKFDGTITPVILQTFLREHGADSPKASRSDAGFKVVSKVPFPIHISNEILTEIDLTESDWRDLMQASGYEVPEKKERRKSKSSAAAIPLITPTKQDAEKLQALWNAQMAEAISKHRDAAYMTAKVAEIKEITQAIYSANSKSEYDKCTTIELDANGKEVCMGWKDNHYQKIGVPAFRVRIVKSGEIYKAKSVIVLTDKPGKSLPIEWPEVV